ncbi:MAG: hypothetical protein A2X45_08550 [Lentisphaerae bacterium GWF2_50_93]|nr:MAG: hypothetical protein A2X45_08550 [Lentisphaerae bacterium GWF2_50_93]
MGFMASLGLSAQDPVEIKAPELVKEKDKFHIYLFIGGSNMTGKVLFPKIDKKIDSRIFILNGDNEWKPSDEAQKFQDKTGDLAIAGPAISFGKFMIQNNKKGLICVGIINCASENSQIKDWAKGGELYNKAVDKVKLAQKIGVLKGIAWHQGEPDAKNTDLKTYEDSTVKLISDLRLELAPEQKIFPLPFVGGKLVSYPYDKDADIFREFNENLEKTYLEIDRHGFVESKGLKVKGNSTLFDNDSMIELGRRYAESMSYLYGLRKTDLNKK